MHTKDLSIFTNPISNGIGKLPSCLALQSNSIPVLNAMVICPYVQRFGAISFYTLYMYVIYYCHMFVIIRMISCAYLSYQIKLRTYVVW